MNTRPVTPLATERDFRLHEMFFSTTDARGIILNGNEVFSRVSGFSPEELIGRPHNIIRHPHMPRVAFQLLWENLKAGRAFAAYVKNMAKDGAYYWVLAVIVPISGGRYLSIRFKPTSPTLPVVEGLYSALAAAETEAIGRGSDPREAMAGARTILSRELGRLGFDSYERFSQFALNKELDSRDSRLEAEGRRLFPAALAADCAVPMLVHLYDDSIRAYRQITEVFSELHVFSRFNEQLHKSGKAVLGVADDFRNHALNVNLTAQRHGAEGRTVGVVATFLGQYAQELGRGTGELRHAVERTAAAAEAINADVAMARLQMEMVLCFQSELASGSTQGRPQLTMLADLKDALATRTRSASDAIGKLEEESALLGASRQHLQKVATSIQMAQVRGLTEAARLPEAEDLRVMFGDFRRKIDSTNRELGELDEALDYLRGFMAYAPRRIAAMREAAGEIQGRGRDLAGS